MPFAQKDSALIRRLDSQLITF